MSILTLVALAAIVVVEEEGSPREQPAISVPRSRGVVIDGTLDEAEWRGSAIVRRPEGEVLLRHDGKYLYIGVRSVRRGFPSVCFARGDTVRVAHASFALGEAIYTRSGTTGWRLDAPFMWDASTRTLGPELDQQRESFLAAHGWVGSTVPMGNPRHAEMQIALDQLDPRDLRIGVAFFMEDEGRGEGIASWPRARDDCANDRLVRGYAPERATFRRKSWSRLRLAPATTDAKRVSKPRLAPKPAVAGVPLRSDHQGLTA